MNPAVLLHYPCSAPLPVPTCTEPPEVTPPGPGDPNPFDPNSPCYDESLPQTVYVDARALCDFSCYSCFEEGRAHLIGQDEAGWIITLCKVPNVCAYTSACVDGVGYIPEIPPWEGDHYVSMHWVTDHWVIVTYRPVELWPCPATYLTLPDCGEHLYEGCPSLQGLPGVTDPNTAFPGGGVGSTPCAANTGPRKYGDTCCPPSPPSDCTDELCLTVERLGTTEGEGVEAVFSMPLTNGAAVTGEEKENACAGGCDVCCKWSAAFGETDYVVYYSEWVDPESGARHCRYTFCIGGEWGVGDCENGPECALGDLNCSYNRTEMEYGGHWYRMTVRLLSATVPDPETDHGELPATIDAQMHVANNETGLGAFGDSTCCQGEGESPEKGIAFTANMTFVQTEGDPHDYEALNQSIAVVTKTCQDDSECEFEVIEGADCYLTFEVDDGFPGQCQVADCQHSARWVLVILDENYTVVWMGASAWSHTTFVEPDRWVILSALGCGESSCPYGGIAILG